MTDAKKDRLEAVKPREGHDRKPVEVEVETDDIEIEVKVKGLDPASEKRLVAALLYGLHSTFDEA